MNIQLSELGFICALGTTQSEIIHNAKNAISGLKPTTNDIPNTTVPFGWVNIPDNPNHNLRAYTLLDATIAQIQNTIKKLKSKYTTNRIGIILGSSNTGIHEAQKDIEQKFQSGKFPSTFSFSEIELGSPSTYLKNKLGITGPSYTISTACSSSAKAFSSARNLIENNICDAVIVGGVDSHCAFAQNGFFALESLSQTLTNPMSQNRNGINLGEGCALFIIEKSESKKTNNILLLGIGETSDAYHTTHPDPTGLGAKTAMQLALNDAKLSPEKIDYINMHGTGTIANDAMESTAIYDLFGENTLCASTKPLTGHTLGASGAVELALSYLMIKQQFIIPHKYDGKYDNTLPQIKLATGNEQKTIKYIQSNSFAFGGSNASIIIGGENV